MGGEQKPHDRWPLAIWWSILGIIAGMVGSSLLESSGRSYFVWNPGTITVGIVGGIFGGRIGYAVAVRKMPGNVFWAIVAIIVLLLALLGPTP